jgi:hypothetical protein
MRKSEDSAAPHCKIFAYLNCRRIDHTNRQSATHDFSTLLASRVAEYWWRAAERALRERRDNIVIQQYARRILR